MPEVPDDTAAALLRHPYGLFLVGSAADGDANLMTATWGTQCSFKPRMYAVFIEEDARTRRLIDKGGAFSICLLPADVEDVVSHRAMVSENCLGISRKDTNARWLLTSLPSSSSSGN